MYTLLMYKTFDFLKYIICYLDKYSDYDFQLVPLIENAIPLIVNAITNIITDMPILNVTVDYILSTNIFYLLPHCFVC